MSEERNNQKLNRVQDGSGRDSASGAPVRRNRSVSAGRRPAGRAAQNTGKNVSEKKPSVKKASVKKASEQKSASQIFADGKSNVSSAFASMKERVGRQKRKKRVLNARSLERRKQVRKMELIGGAVILVSLILWYSLTAASYRSKFLRNTWINGVNVSYMSAEEVEKILQDSVEDYQLELGFRGGMNETLTHDDILLSYVSSGEVAEILRKQKRLSWLSHRLGKKSSYTVSTSFRFDQAKLRSSLQAMPEFQSGYITKPVDSHIIRQDNGIFHVTSEVYGNEPDLDQICSYVSNAVNASVRKLNLYLLENAYKQPSKKSDDAELTAHAAELNAFADRTVSIIRKNNKSSVLRRNSLTKWVSYDSDSDLFYIDQESLYQHCYEVIQRIADKDNDIHTVAAFQTTSYGEVVVPCSHYGYELDVGDEAEKLKDVLNDPAVSVLELENSVPETFDALNNRTYVEVDITNQEVYYYLNGNLEFQTPCVSGQERNAARRTPSGIYSVLAFDENVTLGSLNAADPSQRYESHVNYWMPFFGSYGMHDADWRDEDQFGGEIYKYYGSHGCVNLPPSAAKVLFTTLERYTPVIVCRQGDNAEEGTEKGDVWWNPPEDGLYYNEGGNSED